MSQEMHFTGTNPGKSSMDFESYTYCLEKVHANKNKSWKCRRGVCTGTLLTDEHNIVLKEGIHSCSPDVDVVEVENCGMVREKGTLEEPSPVPNIYKETFSKAVKSGLDAANEVTTIKTLICGSSQQSHCSLATLDVTKALKMNEETETSEATEVEIGCQEVEIGCQEVEIGCQEVEIGCEEVEVECEDEEVEIGCEDEEVECENEELESEDEDSWSEDEDSWSEDEEIACDVEEIACDVEEIACDVEETACDVEETACEEVEVDCEEI